MGIKVPVALVPALLLPSIAWADPLNFTFDIENPSCGQVVDMAPGERARFDVYVTLTTPESDPAQGARGWSFGVSVKIGLSVNVESVSLDGLKVETVFEEDDDGDPSTPPLHHDSYLQDLGGPEVPTAIAERGVDDSGFSFWGGVISKVILRDREDMVLKPGTTQRVLKFTVSTVRGAPVVLELTSHLHRGSNESIETQVISREVALVDDGSGPCRITPCCAEDLQFALAPAGRPLEEGSGDMVYEELVPPGDAPVPVDVLLTTRNLGPVPGPQGWSLSVGNELCMDVKTVTLKKVFVDTHFEADPDLNLQTPPVIQEHYSMELSESFIGIAHPFSAQRSYDPQLMGVVSSVIMKSQERMTLYPNTTATILRVVYQIHVEKGQTITCRALFKDQLWCCLPETMYNWITIDGGHVLPVTRGLVIRLTGGDIPPRPLMRRGDVNADLRFDISDVVSLINGLFLDAILPCLEAGDSDANGRAEITDVIYLLNWLFLAGPPPAAPYPHCGYAEGGSLATCPLSSNACHGLF